MVWNGRWWSKSGTTFFCPYMCHWQWRGWVILTMEWYIKLLIIVVWSFRIFWSCDPSRNLGPPENALAAYSICKCTSRHSPSTSSKTIREIDCKWAHSVRSSSLPIEHPKPPLITKICSLTPPITLHNLLLIATILHDLVSIVTGWHQPPNPPWNPNKLLTDRKKCILK